MANQQTQILIFEDEPFVAEILCQFIRLIFPSVTPVVTHEYQSFYSCIERQQPAAVMIDVGLLLSSRNIRADRKGETLLEEIRQQQKTAPIILMSGRTKEEVIDIIPTAASYPLLPKPFTFKELVDILESVLPKHLLTYQPSPEIRHGKKREMID